MQARTYIRSFRRDEQGALTIMLALLLPLVIGFVGLALDTSVWYMHQRQMQSAADAAAIATGYNIDGSQSEATLSVVAEDEAERNGYGPADNVTVTVHSPPETGTYAGNAEAVEILLSQPEARMFSRVIMGSDPTIAARAVALNSPSGRACVLALDPTADDALRFQGNTTVNFSGCTVAANSNSGSAVNVDDSAISLSGSVEVNAQGLYTVGTYSVQGSAQLNTVDPPVTNGAAITDPYADLANPTFSGCAGGTGLTINNTVTLSPTVFCSGLQLNSHADVTFQAGTYYIDRGTFRINGGAKVRGTGVTFVLTSSTGAGYATVNVNGSADVVLSAPTSGEYEGILFYQDRRAESTGSNTFNGNSSTELNGALYFPNQFIDFNGGNSAATNTCTQLIARLIRFSGNSNMSNNCTGSAQSDIIIPGTVQLVE